MENIIRETDKEQTNGGQAADNDVPKGGLAGLMQSLEREDGYISLVRVMAAAAFIVFMALYVAAFIKGGYALPHFDTFSAFVGAVIFATLGSKYLDFKQQVGLGSGCRIRPKE